MCTQLLDSTSIISIILETSKMRNILIILNQSHLLPHGKYASRQDDQMLEADIIFLSAVFLLPQPAMPSIRHPTPKIQYYVQTWRATSTVKWTSTSILYCIPFHRSDWTFSKTSKRSFLFRWNCNLLHQKFAECGIRWHDHLLHCWTNDLLCSLGMNEINVKVAQDRDAEIQFKWPRNFFVSYIGYPPAPKS